MKNFLNLRILLSILCVICCICTALVFFLLWYNSNQVKKNEEYIDEEYVKVMKGMFAISPHEYDYLEEGDEPLYGETNKYRHYKNIYLYGYLTDVEYMKLNIFIYNIMFDDNMPDNYFFDMHDNYFLWSNEQKIKWDIIVEIFTGGMVEVKCRGILSDLYFAYDDYYESTGNYINDKAENELVCEDWIALFNWIIDTRRTDDYRYIRDFVPQYYQD